MIVWQSNSLAVDSLRNDHEKLHPVQVGGQTWYDMPKERLGKIANYIEKLERTAELLEPMDTALTICQSINFELRTQVKSFEDLANTYQKELENNDYIILNLNKTIQDANRGLTMFDQENRKLKKQRKGLIIGGTAITIGLSAALLIIAL